MRVIYSAVRPAGLDTQRGNKHSRQHHCQADQAQPVLKHNPFPPSDMEDFKSLLQTEVKLLNGLTSIP